MGGGGTTTRLPRTSWFSVVAGQSMRYACKLKFCSTVGPRLRSQEFKYVEAEPSCRRSFCRHRDHFFTFRARLRAGQAGVSAFRPGLKRSRESRLDCRWLAVAVHALDRSQE